MTRAALNKKSNKNPTRDIKKQTDGNVLPHITFWGLAAIILLSPLFRGLFFPAEQYKALIFASVVFWLVCYWRCFRERSGFFAGPMDYFVLGLPLVYAVSAFNAANTGLAVDEVVKNTLYFMVYWSAARLVTGKDEAVKILSVIYLAAVGLALAGLMTATGLVNIKDGFLNGRIYSSFQYPNALAGYLIAALFIGLYFWQRDAKYSLAGILGLKKSKQSGKLWDLNFAPYIFSVLTFLICTVLMGTKSNGGFLTLLLVLCIFFLFPGGSEKIRVFTHFLSVAMPAAVTAWLFIGSAMKQAAGTAWLTVCAGAVLVIMLQYINGRLTALNIWDRLWDKKVAIMIGLTVLIMAGGLVAYQYAAAHQELIGKALAEMRLRNATERMYFYSDAMKMVEERPLLGWGGGGWQEAYRSYQGYLYNSNQVHSYYLQLLVEAGAAGLSAALGIWGMFLYMAHRLYRSLKDYDDKILTAALFAAALAIGGHAIIDFNLSLSALTIALFTLFGITAGIYANKSRQPEEAGKKIKVSDRDRVKSLISLSAVTAFCLTAIIASSSFSAAEGNRKDAAAALEKGDLKTAADIMALSTSNNPFKSEFDSGLAMLYAQQGNTGQAIDQMQKALAKAGHNSRNQIQLAGYHLASGQYENAVAQAEKALLNAPYQIEWYEVLSQIYFYSGTGLLQGGKKDEARLMFSKVAEVENRIGEKVSGLGDLERKLWNVAPMLAPTPAVNLYSGAALTLSGKYAGAEESLNKALAGEKTKGEALLWLAVLSSKKGDNTASAGYLNQASALMPNAKDHFDRLSNLKI